MSWLYGNMDPEHVSDLALALDEAGVLHLGSIIDASVDWGAFRCSGNYWPAYEQLLAEAWGLA